MHGTIRKGQQVAWCRADGTVERAKVAELYVTENHDRIEVDEPDPARSSPSPASRITIGETLADAEDPSRCR
jgi:GTP-binding protein